MGAHENTSKDVFEAELIEPEQNQACLIKACDLVSDLLDMVHEVKLEVVSLVEGELEAQLQTRLQSSEDALLSAQHFLNFILAANNEETTK